MKINTIRPQEDDFLKVLEFIALKPELLYCIGKLPKNESVDGKKVSKRPKTVAIVGARKMTKYGQEIAYKIAFELARRGVVVVSGLAYGIDSVAHRGALDGRGITVAVLGTAIDEITPRPHRGLAEEIVKKDGAIISEYFPGERVFTRTSFLERNRIISGLSDAVVVVEAASRSGSLNTAAHALDQGKDLWVVPGDITRASAMGCNELIRQGAMPITSVDRFVDEIMPVDRVILDGPPRGENELENKILQCIFEGVRDGEDILEKIGVGAADFNITMTMLEIRGVVRGIGGNMWVLG